MAPLCWRRAALLFTPVSLLRFPDKHSDLKVLPVDLRLPREPIGIVTLKNRTLRSTARLFIELAREVAKPPGEAKMMDAMSLPGTGLKTFAAATSATAFRGTRDAARASA